MKPLAIDLYCGLGGWTEGLLAEGYDVIGFDNEQHAYGDHRYPAQLVLQDVRTLHGSQFKDAALIVASPPCQEYSYMAMPWSRAKAIAAEYRSGVRDVAELTELFDACFRIQREASAAKGEWIPLVVENVRGAIPWVGRSRWNFGSFHLWGDVPALMPMTKRIAKLGGGLSWSDFGKPDYVPFGFNHENEKKVPGFRFDGSGRSFQSESVARTIWDDDEIQPDAERGTKGYAARLGQSTVSRRYGSKSSKRKAASALIAKIPLVLARHIAATYYPREANDDA